MKLQRRNRHFAGNQGRLRCRCDDDFHHRQDREAEIVRYDDYLPPDVKSARLWLVNCQPGRWRERREVDVTLTLPS